MSDSVPAPVITLGATIYDPKGRFSFEFLAKNGQRWGIQPLTEIFFLLPPDEVTVAEGYRVNITKTFGGGFVTDYGNDFKTISLSGEIYMYYEGVAGNYVPTIPMLGVDQFFQLRYVLSRWRDFYNGTQGRTAYRSFKTGVLETLGKFGRENTLYDNVEIIFHDFDDDNHFSVVITSFDMTRSKDDPWTIAYSIEMTVIRDAKKPPFLSGDLLRKLSPSYWLSAAKSAAERLEVLVSSFNEATQALMADVGISVEIISQIVDECASIIDGTKTTIADLMSFGDTLSDAADRLQDIFAFGNEEGGATETEQGGTGPGTAGSMSGFDLEAYITNVDIITQLSELTVQINGLDRIMGASGYGTDTKPKTPVERGGSSLAIDEGEYDYHKPETTNPGGFRRGSSPIDYTVRGAESVEEIAEKVMGDPEKGTEILELNSLVASDFDDDGMAGKIIQVPSRRWSPSTRRDDNVVYPDNLVRTDVVDQRLALFGTDLKLSDTGGLLIDSSGDLLTEGGLGCLASAVEDRMSNGRGTLNPYHPGWGLMTRIGSAPDNIGYDRMVLDIESQAEKDPRIDRAVIDRSRTEEAGDKLEYVLELYPISGDPLTVESGGGMM